MKKKLLKTKGKLLVTSGFSLYTSKHYCPCCGAPHLPQETHRLSDEEIEQQKKIVAVEMRAEYGECHLYWMAMPYSLCARVYSYD